MKFVLLYNLLLLFRLVSIQSSCVSTFISGEIFDAHVSNTGRNLLQNKQNCPVNFEFQNYTIITSQCKGPKYPADLCCKAFKELACPFAQELNDLTNECATTMFSYINLYGKYPPGLFASECREGKLGLECNATSTQLSDSANASPFLHPSSLLMLVISPFILSQLC